MRASVIFVSDMKSSFVALAPITGFNGSLSFRKIPPKNFSTLFNNNNNNKNNNNNNDIKVKEPDQTSRLTGPSNPADKAGEEKAEAKGDH